MHDIIQEFVKDRVFGGPSEGTKAMTSLVLIALMASAATAEPRLGAGARLLPVRACGAQTMRGTTITTTSKDGQTVVRHSGASGNPATVIKRGAQGEIVVEQSGPCSSAKVSQTGADNRAIVRQDGSGNRAVIRQGGSK